MNELHRGGVQKVIAIAVVGEPQPDDHSKRIQITLTPCDSCRTSLDTLMSEDHPKIEPDTEIFTVHSGNVGLTQLFRAKDLRGMHEPRVGITDIHTSPWRVYDVGVIIHA